MPFWGQEGRFLDCWRASSSTEKGVSLKREKRDYWNILTVPIYLISVSSFTEDSSFFRRGHFFFSQSNTEEQNTQSRTETLSQPISRNVTPIFSSNALWTLYAEGLLWVRNSAQKSSVRSVSSVRERNTHSERKRYPQWEKEIPTVREKTTLSERKNSPRTLLAAQ